MAENLLNDEDYYQILVNQFQDKNLKYVSAEVKKISEQVEGLLGEHYSLKITYLQKGIEKRLQLRGKLSVHKRWQQILQNLKEDCYKLPQRNKPFTKDQVQCLLKSLALFHGAGFVYERKKSEELERNFVLEKEYPLEMSELFFTLYFSEEKLVHDRYWKSNFILFDKLIDLLLQSDEYKEVFKK